MSTRIALALYDGRKFCNGCNKVNIMRMLMPARTWTVTEVIRRFGAAHPFAEAWRAVATTLTAPVVAGLCVANVTAASARKLLLHRTGTLARGPGIYLFLNHVRVNAGGNLKTLVSTIFVDRPNVAAGVLTCYGTRHSIENINGQLTKMLRDPETAMKIAEKGRFRFPKPLPRLVQQDAEKNGISQAWWWAAIGSGQGPKPTLSSRWVAVPNRNDDRGSYTFVAPEMWHVLDAIRGGWRVDLMLAPTLDPKDLRPRTGANGIAPVHASYEPSVVLSRSRKCCAESTRRGSRWPGKWKTERSPSIQQTLPSMRR